MTETEHKKALYDMLYLTSCGITQTIPETKKIKKMNLENVYKLSKAHFLDAITYYALENAEISEDAIIKEWHESRDKAIRKNMMLDIGRMQIESFMEDKGIWYMPLKGVYLKELYPGAGMRQMSDNDILFNPEYRKEVCKWFIKNGYEIKKDTSPYHDEYIKNPVYNYEMHVSLYPLINNTPFSRYYKDVSERLIKNENDGYGYHFSDEDFYIYITTHAYKHLKGAGTGLRTLLDTYVYIKSKGKTLDWKYIENEMKKLRISGYEKRCRNLSRKVFENPNNFRISSLSENEKEMLECFLYSNAYGTSENKINSLRKNFKNRTGKTSKFNYIINRLFPDMKFIKKYYSFFYKHKYLIPFLWIYRLTKCLTVGRKRIFNELKALKKSK